VYRVETYREVHDQIAALPDDALAGYAEALWGAQADPVERGADQQAQKHNPTGPVRTLPFGAAGMVTYLILEDQRRVDVITVVWAG
jgi:hypothetical protein